MKLNQIYLILGLILIRSLRFKVILTRVVFLIAITFFMFNHHIRVALIQLELLTLRARLTLSLKISAGSLGARVMFMLFTVAVIEATLGLSLLALTSRKASGELFKLNL